jgi:hypothetical protein
MRSRRFLPMVDGLDCRLLLDASVLAVSSVVVPTVPDNAMPGDEIDPTQVVDYSGSGDPTSTDDPMNPTEPTVDSSDD